MKYNNQFEIDFKLNGSPFSKKIETVTGLFFSTSIKTEAIEELAREARVQISEDNKVALCFKSPEIESGETGLLYNYLPTKQKSPFKFVRFHADFHTSVDRKTIEFDHNSKIGKYNATLLEACLELYFSVLIRNLASHKKHDIKIDVIDVLSISNRFINFNWNLLEINTAFIVFKEVTHILKIWNWNYETATNLFACLAEQYFSNRRDEKEHQIFFKNISVFLENYVSQSQQYYVWVERFKNLLAKKILEEKIQVIPKINWNHENEILYKDSNEDTIVLPDFLGIKITNFKIEDDYLSKRLKIKQYSDINVLFKYFRQVGIKGDISEKHLSETGQIQFLKSLYQLFKNKKEKIESFVHRYDSFLSDNDRKNYSAQNITAFSVSTVFLKTKAHKYKPAQLCFATELDDEFLNAVMGNEELSHSFLRFLGVSREPNYLVVDKKIQDKFSQGIEFIPMPLPKDETENLTAKEIIPNIAVITSKKSIHPALINYNRYSFLEDISNTKFRKQLQPLKIGDYDTFPNEYTQLLLDVLENELNKHPHEVFRLYSANLFHLFNRWDKYLIVNHGKYYWSSNTNFKIAQNRNDFELLKPQTIDLLCFFNGNEVPENLVKNKIELKPDGVELNNEKDITIEFKQSQKFIPFILTEISYLSNNISERDYLKEVSRRYAIFRNSGIALN